MRLPHPRRRDLILAALVLGAAIAIGAGYWASRPSAVSTSTPAAAPRVGSCWALDAAASRGAHPWPGQPVDCAQSHTVEVFLVGQVDVDLVRQARDASGDDAKLAENLMYGQARLACSAAARTYLGGDWHAGQVDILANWIKPDRSGFFACAGVQTTDPGATRFVSRTASLRGSLAPSDTRLAITCVKRSSGEGAMAYSGCAGPHDGEFVGTYTITPPEAPFNQAGVRAAAERGCADLARGYLGLPAGASRADLRSAYVGPTSASAWLGSDQTFACYLMADTPVRGSVHGLAARSLRH